MTQNMLEIVGFVRCKDGPSCLRVVNLFRITV